MIQDTSTVRPTVLLQQPAASLVGSMLRPSGFVSSPSWPWPWPIPSTPWAYVDPLIGTINGGQVFAGATLPYGLAKAVADVDNGGNGENTSGFDSPTGPT